MEILVILCCVAVMAFLARASGAGGKFGTLWLGWSGLPELLFGVAFGVAAYVTTGDIYKALGGAVLSWRAMELGHGTFYDMRGYQDINRDPGQTTPRMTEIDHFMHTIFHALKKSVLTPAYSWACMGFKGFLIGFAAAPFGLALIVAWPALYAVTRKVAPDKPELAEWATGAAAGLTIAATILVYR